MADLVGKLGTVTHTIERDRAGEIIVYVSGKPLARQAVSGTAVEKGAQALVLSEKPDGVLVVSPFVG